MPTEGILISIFWKNSRRPLLNLRINATTLKYNLLFLERIYKWQESDKLNKGDTMMKGIDSEEYLLPHETFACQSSQGRFNSEPE